MAYHNTLLRFAIVSLSLGIAVSAAIVTGAFLYVRYGDAPGGESELENPAEVTGGL
jgi:hypothetical protein